jgi:hypothetical protein
VLVKSLGICEGVVTLDFWAPILALVWKDRKTAKTEEKA